MKQAEGLRNNAFLDDRPFAGKLFPRSTQKLAIALPTLRNRVFSLYSKAATKYFRKKPGTLECLRLIPEFVKFSIYIDFTIILMYQSTEIRYSRAYSGNFSTNICNLHQIFTKRYGVCHYN
ncbi:MULTISPECIES: hypothetical protein [unclassified Microcoleus]|uniref:hypothetical protein n=1 Tax=unclassified Microcoleus TaxID=2642155 RepID=UPI002FD3BFDD